MVIPHSLRGVFFTLSFWLVLSAQFQGAGSSSAARRLLQGDGAGDTPGCPQARCSAPPCNIRPCLAGWKAVNDFCTCNCNCAPPPDFAGECCLCFCSRHGWMCCCLSGVASHGLVMCAGQQLEPVSRGAITDSSHAPMMLGNQAKSLLHPANHCCLHSPQGCLPTLPTAAAAPAAQPRWHPMQH